MFVGRIGVAEAARRLGVSPSRVHRRIADGSLPAERIGAQWVIDETSLPLVAERRTAGRPLSERSAWALIAASRGDDAALAGLTAVERRRAEKRLAEILGVVLVVGAPTEEATQEVARLLRSLLRNRASRQLWRASVRDLPDLREDCRLTLSGLSDSSSGIAAGDLVEGYVFRNQLEAVVRDYLLIEESVEPRGNVILHVGPIVPAPGEEIGPLLLAADLAEHRRPREEARASELLRELASD